MIRLAKEAQIDEQMHFNGQVTDLYERYKQYSIMVMTSRYEGFPMTLLEGIGNGLPLVSFDIPTGPSEIIDDGENGYLLQEGDINGMVYRLDQLMSNQNLRIAMSDNSRTKSRAFAIQDITEEFGKTLHAVV